MPNIVSSSVRAREYLTAAEVERLMAAARKFSLTGSWPTSKTIGIAWPWQPISCAVAWL